MSTETIEDGVPEPELVKVEVGDTSSPEMELDDDPWATFGQEIDADDSDGDFEESLVEPEAPIVEPKKPDITEVVEVPAELTPTPTTTPTPTPTPTETPVVQEPPTPIATREELLAKSKVLEDELTKTYALSSEDVDAVRLSPEEVLPRLAARVTIDTYERVLETLVSQLPSFVRNVIETSNQQSSVEREFYEANPVLAEYAQTNGRARVDELAAQIAVMLRAQNPTMSKADLIQKVGKAAETMLGLQSKAPAVGGTPTPPPPKGVEATVVEEVVRRPFVPARGAPSVQAQRQGPVNPFESLNAIWDNDEFGD